MLYYANIIAISVADVRLIIAVQTIRDDRVGFLIRRERQTTLGYSSKKTCATEYLPIYRILGPVCVGRNNAFAGRAEDAEEEPPGRR